MMSKFELDPILARDTYYVGDMEICQVLLKKDARWLWLILVPMRPNIREIHELCEFDQMFCFAEMRRMSEWMSKRCDKVNIGMLGNIVNQLHIHIIGRNVGDTAWPGPVWACPGDPKAYENVDNFLSEIGHDFGF